MAYQLSASKLQAYQRCAQAYYFKYERGIPSPGFFGSTALGTALHKALAKIYGNWHYLDAKPDRDWIDFCWSEHQTGLSLSQIEEGQEILEHYYDCFIANETAIRKPLAVEGKIKARLPAYNVEFILTGRYDRLDWLDEGLELIDYKSTKEVKELDPSQVDLQIGLYYLALEQAYKQSLRRLSLLYLRTGDKVSFDATPDHKQMVEETISEIAMRLRTDCEWKPAPGKQCDRCTYSRYCSAVQEHPEPLPADAKPEQELQLVLGL
ncbi:MAG: PD-(D/E)XK nuclease family protein [Microcoleus vaginatus WJT46-NPBG5]|jgi:putative RecB family exonuclease|nr:PD-(D/E)XK nuclease family protein [Microcoleus vaginatus WJT46-NPBG5]